MSVISNSADTPGGKKHTKKGTFSTVEAVNRHLSVALSYITGFVALIGDLVASRDILSIKNELARLVHHFSRD